MLLGLRKTLKRSSRSRSRNYLPKRAGRRSSRNRKHTRKHTRRIQKYRGGNSNANVNVQDTSKLLHKGDMPYMPYTRNGKTYSGFQFE